MSKVTQLAVQKPRCEVGGLPPPRVCVLKSCAIQLLSEKKEIEEKAGEGGRGGHGEGGEKRKLKKKEKIRTFKVL